MKAWEPDDRVAKRSDPGRGPGAVAFTSGWALVAVDWDSGDRETHHSDELMPKPNGRTPQSEGP